MTRASRPRWFLPIAAPMLPWAAHFVVVYSLQGLACARGWPEAGARLALVGATVVALLVLSWIGMRAWRCHRAARERAGEALMAWLVLALTALALVATLFTSLPILLLTPCE